MHKADHDKDFLTSLYFQPLSKENWGSFVELFGNRGACGTCWCMSFRLSNTEFEEGKFNDGNKKAMKELVWSGAPTGILAFYEDMAIGWCAFAPREDFPKLAKSRVHKRIDERPVWSIPCSFIHKDFRRKGLSVEMLKGAINYAASQGIDIIEAYPTIPTKEKLPDAFAWIGLYKSFERAGFKVVDRTSKSRPMVRYYINKE